MTRARRVPAALRLAGLGVRAWCGLAAFDVAARLGFARVHVAVRACRVNATSRHAPAVDEVVWAVEEACVWYVKRVPCLQRSAVAARLLRRCGVRAELVIGFRPLPFESHAWVEVDGRVVNDRQQYRTAFTVIDRL
jgi:hypothetical protein